jgi:hypothetical protein
MTKKNYILKNDDVKAYIHIQTKQERSRFYVKYFCSIIGEKIKRKFYVYNNGQVYDRKASQFVELKTTKDGYLFFTCKFGDLLFLVHTLIGKAFINDNGEKNLCIDHIDKNKQNNDVKNLRWVSRSLNQRNQKIGIRNTSGVLGVCYMKSQNVFLATWYDLNGKRCSKSFSIKKYGFEEAKEMAIKNRKEKEIENNYMCSFSTLIEFNEAKEKQTNN